MKVLALKLFNIDPKHDFASIWIFLRGPSYCYKGIGFEVMGKILHFGFYEIGQNRIELEVYEFYQRAGDKKKVIQTKWEVS